MGETAILQYRGKNYELPVVVGTENEPAIDIRQLRAQSGLITLDDGYGNTGACESAITFIDGETGVLRYRGYPIEELAEKSNFIESAYLLIFGELPSAAQLKEFRKLLSDHEFIHEDLRHNFEGFPPNAHPMAILSAMINAVGCFQSQVVQPSDAESFTVAAARLMSKVRTIAAASYKKSIGRPMIYPRHDLYYTANFLHMMFSKPYQNYEPDPEVVRAMDLILLLHADHEQNCSTSTVRMVGSARANLWAAVAAGVCALWGPLHGGANQEVIEMLSQIHASGQSVESFIIKAKDKHSNTRLMGFGHRVYKNFDPRARIIKQACDAVLKKLGIHDPLLEIAKKLEETALRDPYFIERKLYPNVDFYSGIIMRAIGIPVNMFTVMFAIGRIPGWIAHWREVQTTPNARINRPRQVYQGAVQRSYVPIEQREWAAPQTLSSATASR
ncbi:MAG: Citrate synthase 1 [Phycisphaerae bacterium]|nr:Citrate synthase 1 [Phycisphaerae bacterium]